MAKRRRDLRIEYLRLDAIQRDPDNPKDHDLGALAESLGRFGFVAPMGLNETSSTLLWGHGRLDRLEQSFAAGEQPPEGIQVDPGDGMWLARPSGRMGPEPTGRARASDPGRAGGAGGAG